MCEFIRKRFSCLLLTSDDLRHLLRFPVVGMRGLSNHCASCCVNTLLQTLKATWELTELLDRWKPASVDVESCNVPLQLQKVLSAMRSSSRHQHSPHLGFLRCLDRNSVQLGEQHDAGEVLLSILDLIHRQMDDKALALSIQNLFKISVETEVKCLSCSGLQTHSSYLLNFPLHIQEGHNTLEGCLVSFFEPEELKDSNCCFCPMCQTKTPSSKGLKLLSLPPVLCLHLKRFRNVRGRTRKLDSVVSFAESLDLSETLKEAFSQSLERTDCKYTLYAVVVHLGSASFGHYTAFVRERGTQKWYHADDSHVEAASWDQVEDTYGGPDKDTAYMLMYRRGSGQEEQQAECSG